MIMRIPVLIFFHDAPHSIMTTNGSDIVPEVSARYWVF